jgi:DNA-binding NtrC family response regulator
LSVAAAPWVPRDFTRNGALVRDLARGRHPARGGYPASAVAEILIIEDEVVLAAELGRYLEAVGHGVRLADRGAAGIESARAEPPDLVLLDLRLPDASGLDVLADLVAASPDLPVILMTAYGSVRDAVDAMRRGARDYLQKPLDLEELALVVERVLSSQRRDWELHYLRERARVLPQGIVGRDPRLLAIFEQAQRIAAAQLAPGARPAILITGETGTGKGMVAHAIHEILGGGPFVELNCTAMPASLVEAELFGHERGTFTDAKTARPGLFEAADGGAIFLDEIGELDPSVQTKFLKVIEEKRVRRLGALRDRALDVQVIAATHRDLDAAVEAGLFRMDLLHRLRVLSFEIPPLRERPDDVTLIARHFCESLGQQYRREPCVLTPGAEAALRAYAWPGNVRELRNVLERSVLLGDGRVLDASDLVGLAHELPSAASRPAVAGAADASAPAAALPFVLPEGGVDLEAVEREFLRQALERAAGSRTRAAALLGVSRHALRYRLEKFGLE